MIDVVWKNLGWRLKAALGCVVLFKITGMMAIVAVMGTFGSHSLRPLAFKLMVAHICFVVASLLLVGWHVLVSRRK